MTVRIGRLGKPRMTPVQRCVLRSGSVSLDFEKFDTSKLSGVMSYRRLTRECVDFSPALLMYRLSKTFYNKTCPILSHSKGFFFLPSWTACAVKFLFTVFGKGSNKMSLSSGFCIRKFAIICEIAFEAKLLSLSLSLSLSC